MTFMTLIILLQIAIEQAVRHAIITQMKHKKILPKAHTGKLVHHRHTSYSALAVVLLMVFAALFMMSREVAQAAPEDPETAEYKAYAVVPGPIPETAPIIVVPAQGTILTNGDPVPVSGSCQNGMLIKVFKNDVLAGAVFCSGGRFSLNIDLFPASNALVARAYNANNVAGPDSSVVAVRRDVLGQTSTSSLAPSLENKFVITGEAKYKGIGAGDKLTMPLAISGGLAPYAVSVSWGDEKNDLLSRSEAGAFEVSHAYNEPGRGPQNSHDITILATDAAGTKSFIHLVTIVSGDSPTVVGTIKAGYNWSTALKIAWQLSTLATIIVVSFWLGEKRQSFIFRRKLSKA